MEYVMAVILIAVGLAGTIGCWKIAKTLSISCAIFALLGIFYLIADYLLKNAAV